MENALRISFASSLTNLCEKNSSFDSGVLRICYTGENRNRSYFSKEDILNRISNNFEGLTEKTGPWNFLKRILESKLY